MNTTFDDPTEPEPEEPWQTESDPWTTWDQDQEQDLPLLDEVEELDDAPEQDDQPEARTQY